MAGFDDPDYVRLKEQILGKQNGKASTTNGGPPAKTPQRDLNAWKLLTSHQIKNWFSAVPEDQRRLLASHDPDTLVDTIWEQAKGWIDNNKPPIWPLPEQWSATEFEEEIRVLAMKVVEEFREDYLPEPAPGGNLPAEIAFEGYELALQANEDYLKRTPVIEGLCYSSAVSMVTGGKHAGKSTVTRWLAICVAKGFEFLGRKVDQGPVLYLASEDETMAARQELLHLGWCATDPLQFLSMSNVTVDQVKFLESLTQFLKKNAIKLVVMDMLFDFARITDEMSYAQTREALGTIQRVATEGDTHIVTVHHAPKHLVNADAAVTALGSQGLAARVSPIILIRKHGENMHSIVSTSVRDPRGAGIEDTRIIKNADGSLVLGKPWKDWMQAEVFAQKVLDLFECDPGEEMSRGDVQEALGITQQLASATLRLLYKDGRLNRTGSGKKGKPFRYSVPLTEISPANDDPANQNGTRGRDMCAKSPDAETEKKSPLKYQQKLLTPPGDEAPEPEGYGLPDKYGISKGD